MQKKNIAPTIRTSGGAAACLAPPPRRKERGGKLLVYKILSKMCVNFEAAGSSYLPGGSVAGTAAANCLLCSHTFAYDEKDERNRRKKAPETKRRSVAVGRAGGEILAGQSSGNNTHFIRRASLPLRFLKDPFPSLGSKAPLHSSGAPKACHPRSAAIMGHTVFGPREKAKGAFRWEAHHK